MIKNSIRAAGLLFVGLCLAGPTEAKAQDTGWDFTGYLYLWAPAMGGETTTGGSIDVSFSDILDTLDFGVMGAVEARRGRLSLFGDALYLNLSDNQNAAVGPGIPANADADVRGTVFSGSVGYDVLDTGDTRLAVLGGVRGMDLTTSANLSIPAGSQRVSGGIKNWDAIVGVRGSAKIAERWGLSYYADIGAGESDLTAQVSVAMTYSFDRWDLAFGYRYLTWDIGNSQVLSDLTFQGPFVGARFAF
jgi:hypothetical protein